MSEYPRPVGARPRPEPVMSTGALAAGVVTFIQAVVAFLTVAGYVRWDDPTVAAFNAVVVAGVNVTSILVLLWMRARPAVTPLDSPVDAEGVPLVRASDGQSAVTEREAKAARR